MLDSNFGANPGQGQPARAAKGGRPHVSAGFAPAYSTVTDFARLRG